MDLKNVLCTTFSIILWTVIQSQSTTNFTTTTTISPEASSTVIQSQTASDVAPTTTISPEASSTVIQSQTASDVAPTTTRSPETSSTVIQFQTASDVATTTTRYSVTSSSVSQPASSTAQESSSKFSRPTNTPQISPSTSRRSTLTFHSVQSTKVHKTSLSSVEIKPTTSIASTFSPSVSSTALPTKTPTTTGRPTTGYPPENIEVQIIMVLDMKMVDFCKIKDTFSANLARESEIEKSRIRFLNLDCSSVSNEEESATVKFYITEPGSLDLDQRETISVYDLLDSYYIDGKMENLLEELDGKVKLLRIEGYKYTPSVAIVVTFTMAWEEFCEKRILFRKGLAKKMSDEAGYKISPSQIIFLNVDDKCGSVSRRKRRNTEDAEVQFYVRQKNSNEADTGLTNEAFTILDKYKNSGKLSEIDDAFDGKIKSLEVKNEEKPTARRKLLFTQNERLLMGVAAAAAVVLITILIYIFLAALRKSRHRNYHREEDEESEENVTHDNIEMEPMKETRAEISIPPEYSATNEYDKTDNDSKKDVCPLAESEQSSINELEVDKTSAGPDNPAFIHEEDETLKKETTEEAKDTAIKDTQETNNSTESITQTPPAAATNVAYDDKEDSASGDEEETRF